MSRQPAHLAGRSGFTLVEMLASIVIVATVAAVTSPILVSATSAYSKSAQQRRSAERVAGALDRLCRILREAPAKASPAGATNFTAASVSSFALFGGASASLSGTDLLLGSATEPPSPLCVGVTVFELTYFDSAGAAVNVAAGTDSVQRMQIRLAADGSELRTTVWLRASLNE